MRCCWDKERLLEEAADRRHDTSRLCAGRAAAPARGQERKRGDRRDCHAEHPGANKTRERRIGRSRQAVTCPQRVPTLALSRGHVRRVRRDARRGAPAPVGCALDDGMLAKEELIDDPRLPDDPAGHGHPACTWRRPCDE